MGGRPTQQTTGWIACAQSRLIPKPCPPQLLKSPAAAPSLPRIPGSRTTAWTLTLEAVAKEAIPKHPGVEVERVPMLGAEERVRGLQRGGAQLVCRVHRQSRVVHGLWEHQLWPSIERAAGARSCSGREATHEGRLGRTGVRVVERRGPERFLCGGHSQRMGARAPAARTPAGATILGYQGLYGETPLSRGLEHGRGRRSGVR